MLTTIVSSNPDVRHVSRQPARIRRISLGTSDGRAADRKMPRSLSSSRMARSIRTPGKIDFVDVKVDRATDTVAVRASIPNPDGTLVDGQLVQVSVEGDKPEEQRVVPQSALIADQQGTYVFIVEDGKAAVRRVKLGQTSGVDLSSSQRVFPAANWSLCERLAEPAARAWP